MDYDYTTVDGKRVEKNVAADFAKLEEAFRKQFGLDLIVRSGTRTRAEQQRLYDLYRAGRGNQAAVPGTSLHEESNPRGPRALDIYDSGKDRGVMYAGTVRANWIRRNTPKFGFDPAGYRFRQTEPWHIEWTGVFPKPETPGYTFPKTLGVDDIRGLQKLANGHNANDTSIDNKWGDKTAEGIGNFLRKKWGYKDSDNVLGPNMWAAIARWLRADHGYSGNDIPGPNMRAALDRANDVYVKKLNNDGSTYVKPAPPSNPFGIPDVRGLQKIAKDNGGNTTLDNKWGPGSADGFANYLRRKWGYSGDDTLGPNMWRAIARWLRTRYGYVGNDIPGPNMRAALRRANDANYKVS